MIFKDYYKILGLDTNRVSVSEIKNAYREQAKKYHPDVNVGNKINEERFKDINEAYRILSESTTKRKYDRIWVRNVTNKRTSYSYKFKGDFFTMFFGSVPDEKKSKSNIKVAAKGENLEIELPLKISEAFKGITKDIQIKSKDGKTKNIKVKVPSGMKNNNKIRVKGQGKPGKNGGSNGDLLVKIRINNDNDFTLIGEDVKKVLKIAPWEAVLGSKEKVMGVDEEISVYIPAGINSGEIITIEGKGYKNDKGERGNLILEIQISIPDKSTDKEKELYRELKKISNI